MVHRYTTLTLTLGVALGLLGFVAAPAAAQEAVRMGGTHAFLESRPATPLDAAGVGQAPVLRLQDGGTEIIAPEDMKNPKLAMLYSLILPGAGQWYLGEKSRAGFYFVAEGAIWTTYFLLKHQGGVEADRYRTFASIFAGVTPRDDSDYYRVIGNFQAAEGVRSANEAVRQTARSLYPNDRDRQEEYIEENGYFGGNAWSWDSENAYLKYRDIRAASETAYDNASLSLGLLFVNRLVSILDAGLTGRRYTRTLDDGGDASLGLNLDAEREGPGATVTLARTF